ncbi:hypothetical protein [Terrabacter terrigena]|uniref:Phage tail protein n=1 Tax=Terrabacter terrigena TaxID=574718 RepID=A0ABW3N126_9MICO
MAHSVAAPVVLTDPGMLWLAALGTADPTNTVAGSVFTDDPAVAYIPLGATEDGSTFQYQTNVEAVSVAEFFDPIKYATTSRSGSIAFNLASWTLSNYNRALNGGVAALTATSGTGATSLFKVEPPTPGNEVRAMILWESTDRTLRLLCRQTIQGGTISTAFKKAPDKAVIPCTFNMEIPTGLTTPFTMWSAGTSRG